MSGYGITSPFPTIDTVLPARNRRVGGDSRVTWLTGSARGAAGRCWSGAARDSEPEEEERRDRSRPNRRHGQAPEALPRTVRTVDADRLERSCRRGGFDEVRASSAYGVEGVEVCISTADWRDDAPRRR